MTGKEVRRIRKGLRLSQEGLATELGTTKASVSRWESGTHPVSLPMAKLIRIVAAQIKEAAS